MLQNYWYRLYNKETPAMLMVHVRVTVSTRLCALSHRLSRPEDLARQRAVEHLDADHTDVDVGPFQLLLEHGPMVLEEAEQVDDEDGAAGPADAGDLADGDEAALAAGVVQREVGGDEGEGAVGEGEALGEAGGVEDGVGDAGEGGGVEVRGEGGVAGLVGGAKDVDAVRGGNNGLARLAAGTAAVAVGGGGGGGGRSSGELLLALRSLEEDEPASAAYVEGGAGAEDVVGEGVKEVVPDARLAAQGGVEVERGEDERGDQPDEGVEAVAGLLGDGGLRGGGGGEGGDVVLGGRGGGVDGHGSGALVLLLLTEQRRDEVGV